MVKSSSGVSSPNSLQYVICYVVWLVLTFAAVIVALQARTFLIEQTIPFAGLHPFTAHLIRVFSAFIIGFIALVAIIVFEHFLRKALKKGRFWSMVLRIVIIEAAVLGLSYLAGGLLLRMVLS